MIFANDIRRFLMQYCQKCNIHIRGNKRCCPLCQGKLSGEGDRPVFPVLPKKKVSSVTFLRICVFAALISEIVLLSIFRLTNYQAKWTGVAMTSIMFALIDIVLAVYYHRDLLKLIASEFFLAMLASWLVDRHFGNNGWSLSFFIPIAFLLYPPVIVLAAKAVRLSLTDYVIYLVVGALLSFLQIIPLQTGRTAFPVPAVISMAFTAIILCFLFVFRFQALKNASSKYLNT